MSVRYLILPGPKSSKSLRAFSWVTDHIHKMKTLRLDLKLKDRLKARMIHFFNLIKA